MIITNKVTKLYAPAGLSEEQIQEHLDEQNAAGYYLINAVPISGWYRFFWARQEE